MNFRISIFLSIAFFILGGCTSNQSEQQVAQSNLADQRTQVDGASDPRDPLEPVNRVLWDLNWDVLDRYILRPATIAYITVMPQFARNGLLNAVQNLEEPSNLVNNVLQGKGEEGMDSLARFLINSTVGLLGFIDVADKIGITRQDEDFDEVLGVWGVDNGPYVMVPAFGPNDVRSIGGQVVDNSYFPMSIINGNFLIASFVVSALESRAAFIAQEEQIASSPDDYSFIKNAYFQNKAFRVSDGKLDNLELDDQQLDDFDEFESMLDELDSGIEIDDDDPPSSK